MRKKSSFFWFFLILLSCFLVVKPAGADNLKEVLEGSRASNNYERQCSKYIKNTKNTTVWKVWVRRAKRIDKITSYKRDARNYELKASTLLLPHFKIEWPKSELEGEIDIEDKKVEFIYTKKYCLDKVLLGTEKKLKILQKFHLPSFPDFPKIKSFTFGLFRNQNPSPK